MIYQLINFRNGVRIGSEDFSSLAEAETARRQCELVIDEAVLELTGTANRAVLSARREIESERFEIVER